MLRPINDFILIQPDEMPEVTKAGLVIPDKVRRNVNNQPPTATVLAVGPGVLLPGGERIPLSVQPGDKVLFDPRMAKDFSDEGRKLFICQEHAIMGVKEPELVSPAIVSELEGT